MAYYSSSSCCGQGKKPVVWRWDNMKLKRWLVIEEMLGKVTDNNIDRKLTDVIEVVKLSDLNGLLEKDIDNLIGKVWKDIEDRERLVAELGNNRLNWQKAKIRKSEIYGMKSVLIDIEDMRVQLYKSLFKTSEAVKDEN